MARTGRRMIGNILKDKRKALGIDLRTMSDSSGVSYHLLYQIENSNNKTSIKTLESISRSYGIDLNYLIEVNQKSKTVYQNLLSKKPKEKILVVGKPKSKIHSINLKDKLLCYERRLIKQQLRNFGESIPLTRKCLSLYINKYKIDRSFIKNELKKYELALIKRALEQRNCNVKQAYKDLGISKSRLHIKIKVHNIITEKIGKKSTKTKRIKQTRRKYKIDLTKLDKDQQQAYAIFSGMPEQKQIDIVLKGQENVTQERIEKMFERLIKGQFKNKLIEKIIGENK